MLLLALLYAIDCVLPSKRSGAGGSGNTNKKTKREDVRNSDDPIQEEGNERQSTHHLLGLTLTPYHNKDGLEVWDDDERLEFCEAIHDRLTMEFTIRHQDEQVPGLTLARERGDNDNNPHTQCTYEVAKKDTDDEKAEKT